MCVAPDLSDLVPYQGHLYRSIMEGIGYEYKLYFNIIKELMGDYKFSDVRVIGGGAKSAVFNSIKASILGQRYAPWP